MAERKLMSITEFREEGYLQEVNRLLLHPLGLALEVTIEDDCLTCGGSGDRVVGASDCPACKGSGKRHPSQNTERISGVWDERDDPEGVVYGGDYLAGMQAKADSVERQLAERIIPREERLGFVIQPPGVDPPARAGDEDVPSTTPPEPEDGEV